MEMGRDLPVPRPIDLRDRNMAALALAEAMERMREGSPAPATASTDGSDQKGQRLGSMRKLESLRTKLEPLFAAIPPDAEGFDLGFVTESKPRLFVDMLSHVSVDPESGAFRFVQETRNGRRLLMETLDEDVLLSRITDHVAERLLARERALEAVEAEPVPQPASGSSEGSAIENQPTDVQTVPVPATAPAAAADISASAANIAPSAEQPSPAMTSAPSAPGSNGIRAVRFENRREWRRSWLWPILAFLVGIAAAIAAGYLLVTKATGA